MFVESGEWRHRNVDRYQALPNGIDTQPETFKGHRTQQRRGLPLPEYDERGSVTAIMGKLRAAHVAQGSPTVGKDRGSFIEGRNAQRRKKL